MCAQWVAKDPSFLHADSEDSEQTGRMPRLIWVFAGPTTTLLVLSWGGSHYVSRNKITERRLEEREMYLLWISSRIKSIQFRLALCSPVAVLFFSPFSIVVTSHGGGERAELCVFRAFVCLYFAWVDFCPFSHPLVVRGLAAACDCSTPWTFLLTFLKGGALIYTGSSKNVGFARKQFISFK